MTKPVVPNVVHGHSHPKFIELTLMQGNPQVNQGKSSICYVDPAAIKIIARSISGHHKMEITGSSMEMHELRESTMVRFHGGDHIPVEESPEEVNRRRNEALGIVNTPSASLHPIK